MVGEVYSERTVVEEELENRAEFYFISPRGNYTLECNCGETTTGNIRDLSDVDYLRCRGCNTPYSSVQEAREDMENVAKAMREGRHVLLFNPLED